MTKTVGKRIRAALTTNPLHPVLTNRATTINIGKKQSYKNASEQSFLRHLKIEQ
ncbi:MAG: hypothetical protein WCA35_17345 [Kovacikia sp.]